MSADDAVLPAGQFPTVLVAAQAGAAWALDVLYRSLAGPVVGYLRMHGVEDPEDLSSEVFLGAFRNLGGFEGDQQAFRSWVFSIAHRRVIDDRRRRARRIVPVPLDSRDQPGDGRSLETAIIDRLEYDRVIRLCDRLSPDQRDVILLRMVAGLSLDEAAVALSRTPAAVKALQHRAVAALRKELAREISPEGVSR